MKTKCASDDDLSTAACPLMAYSALLGILGFFMVIVAVVYWPPDSHSVWGIVFTFGASGMLGFVAWGVKSAKRWAWLPAMSFSAVFAAAFPIGTIISYYALSSLWRLRDRFDIPCKEI